ncbi:MAG: hypothetical protein ACI9E1_001130 [Cryomorphaceae bacterium]
MNFKILLFIGLVCGNFFSFMRTSWYIYAPLSLLVTFLTLYLCIKDTNTVTPPSPEVTAESLKTWREDNPSIRNTKLSDIPPVTPKPKPETKTKTKTKTKTEPAKPAPRPLPPTPPKPKPAPVVKTPLTSPALSSLAQQNLTTTQLTTYAAHMLKNSNPQLARIAYERVIDHAKDASDQDRELAASAISNLISLTPLWNPDPSVRRKFTLSITVNKKYQPSAETLIPQLEKLIFDASDGMLNPSIKLTSSDAPLSSLSIGNKTSPVRFTINNDPATSQKIHAAFYNAIRNKNNKSQKLTSIPALPTHISSKQALQTYITRLAWVNAAQ